MAYIPHIFHTLLHILLHIFELSSLYTLIHYCYTYFTHKRTGRHAHTHARKGHLEKGRRVLVFDDTIGGPGEGQWCWWWRWLRSTPIVYSTVIRWYSRGTSERGNGGIARHFVCVSTHTWRGAMVASRDFKGSNVYHSDTSPELFRALAEILKSQCLYYMKPLGGIWSLLFQWLFQWLLQMEIQKISVTFSNPSSQVNNFMVFFHFRYSMKNSDFDFRGLPLSTKPCTKIKPSLFENPRINTFAVEN